MLRVFKNEPLPETNLGRLVNGKAESIRLDHLVAGVRAVIIGVPGAFTPVCTQEHLPSFISTAPKFKAAGYEKLICVAANDPFVVDKWARELDPDGVLNFLSDGNLDFARACGMEWYDRRNFLGMRSRRYLLTCDDGIVESIKVEASIDLTLSTAPGTVLIEA